MDEMKMELNGRNIPSWVEAHWNDGRLLLIAAIQREQEVAEEDDSQWKGSEASQRHGGFYDNSVHGGLDALRHRFPVGDVRRRERWILRSTGFGHHSVTVRQRIHRLQPADLRRVQHSGRFLIQSIV